MFKLGLLINPLAGIGGPLALKGSDGESIVAEAMSRGAELRAPGRALVVLKAITGLADKFELYGYSGDMAANTAREAGLTITEVGDPEAPMSQARDTTAAASTLKALGVDLILFVGGDGTARDVFKAVGDSFPVLGVPAGVKMQSAVYAVSPAAAADVLTGLINGEMIDIALAQVCDIDEEAYRQGQIRSRFYGELLVPRHGHFLQHVKSGGLEVEELVIQDIAADVVESMDDETLYFIGAGTTTRGIMDELGLTHSLLGIDAVRGRALLGRDLDEAAILKLLASHEGPSSIVLSVIGGQGHILGRGNQALSPMVLRQVGLDNIQLLATKTKIADLQGRPLMVDSNDPEIDARLSGYRRIITGYHDAIIYPLGLHSVCSK